MCLVELVVFFPLVFYFVPLFFHSNFLSVLGSSFLLC